MVIRWSVLAVIAISAVGPRSCQSREQVTYVGEYQPCGATTNSRCEAGLICYTGLDACDEDCGDVGCKGRCMKDATPKTADKRIEVPTADPERIDYREFIAISAKFGRYL